MSTASILNPVGCCTLIVRVQAEYNVATQTVTLRCRLETPATGQHCGFSELPALLAAIEAELLAMQQRLIVTGQEKQS